MNASGWAALFSLVLALPARACPVCGGEAGLRVQAGIFDDFFATAAAVLLTFPVIAAVVALVHFAVPGRSPVRDASPSGDGP